MNSIEIPVGDEQDSQPGVEERDIEMGCHALVDKILNSSQLDLVQKKEVIEKIRRIAYNNKPNFALGEPELMDSFLFNNTEEGYTYWIDIAEALGEKT